MSKIILFLVFMLTLSCSGAGVTGHPEQITMTSVMNNAPFVEAIKAGNLEEVERMMSSIPDVNARFYVASAKANFTPLQLAAAYGHRLLVVFFLDKGAEIDKRTEGSGRTALHLVVGKNHPQIVEELLKRGADVDAQIERREDAGKTPLHLAVAKNSSHMVQLLIDSRADVNIAEASKRETPLHLALDSSYIAIAEVLVDKGAAVDARTRAGKTPLHLAVEKNLVSIVKILLDKGADRQATDNQGRTPLALARSANHEEIVKILESHEIKFKMRQSLGGLSDSIKSTLERANYRANNPVNDQGHNLLYHAAAADWQEVVKHLVETAEEEDLNSAIYQENYTLSPLYIAVKKGNTELVKLLIYGRAASNHRRAANQEEEIEREAVRDREAVVRKLRDKKGRTLLHVAAKKGHERIVRLLVEFMAIAAEQYENSQTDPVDQNHVMRELAYVIQVDEPGRSAKSLAREARYTSIANFLKEVKKTIEKRKKNLDQDAHVLSGYGGGGTAGVPAVFTVGASFNRAHQTPPWTYKRKGLIIEARKVWRDQGNRLWQN